MTEKLSKQVDGVSTLPSLNISAASNDTHHGIESPSGLG